MTETSPRPHHAPLRIRGLVTGVLELLAPSRCFACRKRSQPPWCGDCAARIRVLAPGCRRCAAPPGGAHACWPSSVPVDATHALLDLQGPVQAALHTARHAGANSAWGLLAPPLAHRIADATRDIDVVTWIPAARSRWRPHQDDGAKGLAHELAQRLDLPLVELIAALSRRADYPPVLRYRPRWRLPGTHVLLVDDSLTSGTSAARAATTLCRAGAGSVSLAVVARAVGRELARDGR